MRKNTELAREKTSRFSIVLQKGCYLCHVVKIKITAVRKTSYTDLQTMYENPIDDACNVAVGHSWVSIDGKKPEQLCDEAWLSMERFVQALARGEENFFNGWMRNPRSAMISCNDGFRPVSFYIEVVE